jgi:hypothetical protein
MTYSHLPNIAASVVFSGCGNFRYRLSLLDKTRTQGEKVCVIMQNPSVANTEVADKSVQFLEKLIFEKNIVAFRGVSDCVVVNQFARIQTRDFQGGNKDIGPQNDFYIEQAIRSSQIVLVAWGKTNPYIDRQKTILQMIERSKPRQILISSKHPSRGSYKNFIIPFEI